jgi:hypothetical protein
MHAFRKLVQQMSRKLPGNLDKFIWYLGGISRSTARTMVRFLSRWLRTFPVQAKSSGMKPLQLRSTIKD